MTHELFRWFLVFGFWFLRFRFLVFGFWCLGFWFNFYELVNAICVVVAVDVGVFVFAWNRRVAYVATPVHRR